MKTSLEEHLGIQTPSPLLLLDARETSDTCVNIWVKRDDLLHSVISGNKWRKLEPILHQALKSKYRHILSFGGAFSNHIHALAYCCAKLDIEFTAIIRGEVSTTPSPMLRDIDAWGARVHFIDRISYQRRDEAHFMQSLAEQFNADLCIPEGGSNTHAVLGMRSLTNELKQQRPYFDRVFLPVGSGATIAGLIKNGLNMFGSIEGIAVLKGERYLESLVNDLLEKSAVAPENRRIDSINNTTSWMIHHHYHHGGYAKTTPDLDTFMQRFNNMHQLPLEKVYSGKCFYAAYAQIEAMLTKTQQADNNSLNTHKNNDGASKTLSKTTALKQKRTANVLIIHTGGLQGDRLVKNPLFAHS